MRKLRAPARSKGAQASARHPREAQHARSSTGDRSCWSISSHTGRVADAQADSGDTPEHGHKRGCNPVVGGGLDELELVETRLLTALERADMAEVAELRRDDFLITTAGWLCEPVDKATELAGLSAKNDSKCPEGFEFRPPIPRTSGVGELPFSQ